MGLFDSLRGKAHTPKPGDPVEKGGPEIRRSTGLASGNFGKPYTPRTASHGDPARAVREGYEVSTWVYRCVEAIATNSAKLQAEVRKGDPKNGSPIPNHPLLRLLNFRPNRSESASFFRQRLTAQLLLSPRGAFVEIVRTNGGDPYSLTLLMPNQVKPIPDPALFVAGYEVGIGSERITLQPEQVLWFRNPHPMDPYRSFTPLEAMGVTVSSDLAAMLLNYTFLQNDGRPGGIVGVKGGLMDDDADELRDYFNGSKNVGRTRVIEADELTYLELGGNPRDAQYLELRGANKAEILEGFGVGETVLVNTNGRTFDNADAELESFWMHTMQTHNDRLSDVWDLIDDDETTFVVFDTSQVQALQRAERERRAEMRDEVAAQVRTVNEYRGERSLDPQDGGDVLRRQMSLVPLDQESKPALPPGPAPIIPAPDPNATPVEPGAITADPAPKAPATPPEPKQAAKNNLGAATLPGVQPTVLPFDRKAAAGLVEKHVKHLEALFASELIGFYERQQRAVLARLGGPKARIGTRHDRDRVTRTTKALDPAKLIPASWDTDLAAIATSMLTMVFDQAGQEVFDVFRPSTTKAVTAGSWDVHDPAVTAKIAGRVTRIVGTNDTTRDMVGDAIAAGEAAGETIPQIAGRVTAVFENSIGSRADAIARTEVTGGRNSAQLEAATQTGVVATKEWLAVGDARTRGSHLGVDGTKAALDETFVVGDSELLYPGDENGDPGETVNCRCTMLYEGDPAAADSEFLDPEA